jgi:hypothetical protein
MIIDKNISIKYLQTEFSNMLKGSYVLVKLVSSRIQHAQINYFNTAYI